MNDPDEQIRQRISVVMETDAVRQYLSRGISSLNQRDPTHTDPYVALHLLAHSSASSNSPSCSSTTTHGEFGTVRRYGHHINKHIRARTYDEMVWKTALAEAGVIPMPTKDARGRRQYKTARDAGMHALRHYYASITLADGVNIKELAEYLGHGDPGFTLRLYTHMLPSSHERARKAVDSRLSRLFSVTAHGAVTEPARRRPPIHPREPDEDPSPSDPGIGL